MQGCIFSTNFKTFPELIYERKKLFHFFRKDLLFTFRKVFVILRRKHFHKISDFGTFPGPRKAYGKYHPWKYDHNYINARILELEKSNYRPVFFNEKILASFSVEMFRGRGTLFWLRIIWKMPCFFVVV